MRKLARITVVSFALLGVLGTQGQPASAAEIESVGFVGSADVGPGIGYPCTPFGDLSKCPPTGFGPNSATVNGFNSTACVGLSATVNESKPLVNAPLCGFTGGGSVHGYCGLSTGTVHGTITVGGVVGGKSGSFSLTFTGVGGALVLSGSITNHVTGSTGTLVGATLAVPTGGSCTNKDAKTFTLVGSVEAVRV